MPFCLATGMFDGADATEGGKGSFAGQSIGVVAGGGQQLRGADGTDAGPGQQSWRCPADEALDVLVVGADLSVEVLPAAGQGSKSEAGAVNTSERGAGCGEVDSASMIDACPSGVVELQDKAAQ